MRCGWQQVVRCGWQQVVRCGWQQVMRCGWQQVKRVDVTTGTVQGERWMKTEAPCFHSGFQSPS